MARDMAKKAVADMRFEAKTYDRFSVKVRKESGVQEALELASVGLGISKNAYVVAAVQEKLIRDGYLSEKSEEVQE